MSEIACALIYLVEMPQYLSHASLSVGPANSAVKWTPHRRDDRMMRTRIYRQTVMVVIMLVTLKVAICPPTTKTSPVKRQGAQLGYTKSTDCKY